MPAVSLPSIPDLSLPDFSDATGKFTGELNAFTQQLGEALRPFLTTGEDLSSRLLKKALAGERRP
ncbi:hypothetical protein [Bradyrhizobium brasilense]|uniref:hypothetical protein n=1 Tax=Bradyrhizobium brasilense TaxID=1419277 RepID=UPI0011784A5D|nr:hypothetical protein [Bradyrhizobium brasilense]